MSFSKCSNLEAKNDVHFKLCHQRDKRSYYNLEYEKFRNNLEYEKFRKNLFRWVSMHLKIQIKEKCKLKTKLTKTNI